jgi:branched-chain amino acid transport system ATP-binding protein
MIRTNNLSKKFGKLTAVDNISIKLCEESDELTFLVGPNGAGKSTLTNLLTGRYIPTDGEIYLDSENITSASPRERIQVGLARSFQLTRVFDDMTAKDNIRTVLFTQNKKSLGLFKSQDAYDKINNRADELLSQFNIMNKKDILAKNLSHGDRKLLDVAMALALEPKYLLLDEPTSGVGAGQTEELIETIVSASRKHGIRSIIVEHDMEIVTDYADQVVALHNGSILANGGPEILEADDELRRILLGLKNE